MASRATDTRTPRMARPIEAKSLKARVQELEARPFHVDFFCLFSRGKKCDRREANEGDVHRKKAIAAACSARGTRFVSRHFGSHALVDKERRIVVLDRDVAQLQQASH